MPTPVAKFFEWTRTSDSQSSRAHCVLVEPPEIAGCGVLNNALLVGNVRQVCDGLPDFLAGAGQQVLYAAGYQSAGVEIDHRCRLGAIRLFTDFLNTGQSGQNGLPALAWVSPVTSSLSGHTGTRAPIRIDGTEYGISPSCSKLLVPRAGRCGPDISVRLCDFPWVTPGCAPLAMIPKVYEGNRIFSGRRQYAIAAFADSNEHKNFFRATDLVLAHEEALIPGKPGKMWHSRHPLICVGRLRRYPKDRRECPYIAAFDYMAVALDARSGGVVSISGISVDYDRWIRPEISKAVCSIFSPGLEKIATYQQKHAKFLENARQRALQEINDWCHVYIHSERCFRAEIASVFGRIMVDAAKDVPGWRHPVEELPDPSEDIRFQLLVEGFKEFIRDVELGDYLRLAEGLVKISETMKERRLETGFDLPNT
jgi:hypothetical protein